MNTHEELPPLLGRLSTVRMTGPPPRLKFLADGLIVKDVLSLVIATGGSGKSLLLMHLALAVVLKRPFFGRKTTGTTVLWCEHELSAALQRQNAAPILAGLGVALDDPRLDQLQFYEAANPLSTQAGIDEFLRAVERVKPDLVVLDSLSTSMAGADVNSAKEMIPVLSMLSRLGITVIANDHVSKGAAGGFGPATALGSTMKGNMARAVFHLERNRKGSTLTATKWNLGRAPAPLRFLMDSDPETEAITFRLLSPSGAVVEASDGEDETTTEVTATSSTDITLAVLRELYAELHRPVTVAEITERRATRFPTSVISERTTANTLSVLKKQGLAENPEKGAWTPAG